MNSFEALKSEKIHLTLTLADVDALFKAGQLALYQFRNNPNPETRKLEAALAKLDEAVNI